MEEVAQMRNNGDAPTVNQTLNTPVLKDFKKTIIFPGLILR